MNPFTVVIVSSHNYPTNSSIPARLKKTAHKFGSKMDMANPVMKAFLAGSFSGTCSTVLFQPLDLVKTRIQNHQTSVSNTSSTASSAVTVTQKPGMFQIVRHVLATERLPGLWRGILPSITRTVPGVGLYFGSLHWLKSGFGDEDVENQLDVTDSRIRKQETILELPPEIGSSQLSIFHCYPDQTMVSIGNVQHLLHD